MTLTLVATEDYGTPEEYPRTRLEVVASGGGFSPLTFTRTHVADGSVWPVIVGADSRLSGGVWTGFDNHCPLGVDVTYQVASLTETSTDEEAYLFDEFDRAWLLHGSDPTRALPAVHVIESEDDSYSNNAGLFDIIGDDRPLVVSDSSGRITSSVVLAVNPDQVPAVYALVRGGSPLLLTVAAGDGRQFHWRWVQASSVEVSRPSAVLHSPFRYLTVSYVVVRQPDFDQSPTWTSGEALIALTALGHNSGDTVAEYATSLDLMLREGVA